MKKITLENNRIIEISDEQYKALEEGVRIKRWEPEGKTIYFIVTSMFRISEEIWTGDSYDRLRLNTGNCFRTEEQAQAHADKLHAIAKVTEYIWANDMASEDQEWTTTGIYKYWFQYDIEEQKVVIDNNWAYKSFSPIPYLKDRKSAEEVLEKFNSELITIYK